MNHQFESAHAIGDEVVVLDNHYGVVDAVRFAAGKVTYDVALDIGGEIVRDVDSRFVDFAESDAYDEYRPLSAPVDYPLDPDRQRCGDPHCYQCASALNGAEYMR